MTNAKQLTPEFFVSPQLQPDDAKSFADAGFRSIISNRPDGEENDQPAWKEISEAARAAGLQTCHIPVTSVIEDEEVAQFRAALDAMPGPVLAYCRSGTRCTILWALAKAGELGAENVISLAANAGYDLSPFRPRLTNT